MLAEMPYNTPLPGRQISARQIILIFALIMAVLYTLESMSTSYQMGHDQTYVGTMLAKDNDPSLYARDYAFHDDSLYRSYIPVIRWFFDKLTHLTGSFDQALLAMVPVVSLSFCSGDRALAAGMERVRLAIINNYFSGYSIPGGAIRRTLGRRRD